MQHRGFIAQAGLIARRGFILRRALVAAVCVLPLAVLIALLSTGVMSRGMLSLLGSVAWAQLGVWTDGGSFLYPTNNEDVIVGASSEANADHLLKVSGSAVFNEQGADADCRIEGDTDAYLISTDASTDRVGVGVDRGFEDPVCKLHVQRSHLASTPTALTSGCVIAAQHNGSTDNDCDINILCGDTGTGGLYITDADTDPNATSGHLMLDADSGLLDLEATTGSLKLTGNDITLNGGQKVKRTAVSGTYTVLTTDYYLGIDTSSGTVALTLPSASSAGAGRVYVFAVETGANNATIGRAGSDVINDGGSTGLTSLTVAGKAHTVTLICTGSEWIVTAKN